ncbi:MAG: apolipoprotein N-acyltransferase, partial [Sphaerochaetaceae bacterium]|nr:apolipoprotein N-acyltransferase [Sphaerochaetaceae bacterium]
YKRNFINLQKMSLEALLQNPDMIIWSETAFVPSVSWYTNYPYEGDEEGNAFDYLRKVQGLVDDFVTFGTQLGTPLLTGNPTSVIKDSSLPPYDENGDWNKLDYNSVILFDEGTIKTTYTKQHLVPFTEHFPYEKELPLLYKTLKANDYHWWEKGTESVIFETSNGITFSTPICFEDVFGDVCAQFIANGSDLLINMTNDSWSGSVAAERQHMAMAIFRSVENRRTTLRGTNSGITCLITPDGIVQGEMEPFKMGYRIWDVPVYSRETYGTSLYTNTIDASAFVCIYLSYAILAVGLVFTVTKTIRKKLAKKEGSND